MRIALLEDEPAQAELVMMWLKHAGHNPRHYATGREILDAINRDTFDMLILDWNLPDINGAEILQRVRDHVSHDIPIMFVTSRDREEDIVYALGHGADDYMIKPVKQLELNARVNALGRRAMPQDDEDSVLELAPYRFDKKDHSISKNGEPIQLTQKEFEVAYFLFRNRGRLLSRSYLLEHVWGQKAELNTRTVDTHMSRIRTKLGISPADGWRLNSIYQHGYRLEEVGSKD